LTFKAVKDPPVLSEAYLYFCTALAALVGGVVAAGFGVELPPGKEGSRVPRAKFKMASLGSMVAPEVNEILMENKLSKKRIDQLTFGQLVGLLSELNKCVKKNDLLSKKIKKKLNRSYVLEDVQLRILEFANSQRAYFTHDKRETISIGKCKEILSKLIDLAKDLRLKQVYPYVIRMKSEAENEYGIKLLEAMDDENNEWLIKTEEGINPEETYFMHSKTKGIAIYPLIIERFW